MRGQLTVVLLGMVVVSACQCGRAPPTSQVLLKEGASCVRDDECETGLCDSVPGTQAVCVRKCTDGCQSNEVCTQLTLGRFSCAKDKGQLCATCMLDADCPYPADKCLLIDGKGVCGRDCAFDQKCPTSYRCLNGVGTDGRSKAQQCTAASGSCSCTAATAGQAVSCTVMNTFGTCTGMRTCDGMTGFGACNARTASRELCNGADDDCDGQIDEDGLNLNTDINNCGACNNVCMLPNATPRCATGACSVSACATNYGNCDLVEANGCEANLLTNAAHCGACNAACTASGATPGCMNGMCTYTCLPGFADVDGLTTNGCECVIPDGGTLTDLPDMSFVDTNCDGLDGEINNGIFVSITTGDDTNPGTMASPVFSILKGAQLAVQNGKRDVYVSQGNFTGPVDLTGISGINIVGGYALNTPGKPWTRSATNVTNVLGGNPALIMSNSNNLLIQLMQFRGGDASGADAQRRGNSAYGARVVNSTGSRFETVTIQAGRGADGLPGTPGMNGGTGSVGGNGGQNVKNDDDILNGCLNNLNAAPAVGTAGASACGRTGGVGGAAGNTNGGTGVGTSGGTGLIGIGGGSAGATTSSSSSDTSVANGANGTDAVDVTSRSDGARLAQLGSLSAAGYLAPAPTDGSDGAHGNGGGGGGGGAGGCRRDIITSACRCYTRGASGAGGGGGGCGGTKGTGGGSGGASIALVLFQSTLTSSALSLRPGAGGTGGAGGKGGTGGTGASGGTRATWNDFNDNILYDTAGRGGNGGKGGKGGDGGHGSGGTGGPAIGVLRNSGSTINMTQVNATTGTAGAGGNGGNGPGSANDGFPGVVATEQVL